MTDANPSRTKPKAWLAWSSGKDSAWALHLARQSGDYEITSLLTTVNRTHERVAMHAVREELLDLQAEAAGLPIVKVQIPSPCSNEIYEAAMAEAMTQARSQGVFHVIFGDLFLEDIRAYREKHLASCGMTPVFPVWRRDTHALANEMLNAGVSAYLTCVDPGKLSPRFAGRRFDASLLVEFQSDPGVDPCGENGEFHTFTYAGPMFRHTIAVEVGVIVSRDGFVFADILPVAHAAASK